MTKVLVVGGEGYIGSRLIRHLASTFDLVASIDAGWFSNPDYPFWLDGPNHRIIMTQDDGTKIGYDSGFNIDDNKNVTFHRRDTNTIDWRDVAVNNFDVVIWLAGHSSVRMSTVYDDARRNTAVQFQRFIDYYATLAKKPLLIYASSASVYGRTKNYGMEDDTIANYNGYYDQLMHGRELYVAEKFSEWKTNVPIIGLRFGTVNGMSFNMRTELMLNSMILSGLENKEIYISNPQTVRAILFMDDLMVTFSCIIGKHEYDKSFAVRPEIYNVCSDNATVNILAAAAKARLNANKHEVDIVETDAPESPYSFKMSTDKLVYNSIDIKKHNIFDISEDLVCGYTKYLNGHNTQGYTKYLGGRNITATDGNIYLPPRFDTRDEGREYL